MPSPNLAKEPVPDIVNKAYGESKLALWQKTLPHPKTPGPPIDHHHSAGSSQGCHVFRGSQNPYTGLGAYELDLQERIGIDQRLMSRVITRAKKGPQTCGICRS